MSLGVEDRHWLWDSKHNFLRVCGSGRDIAVELPLTVHRRSRKQGATALGSVCRRWTASSAAQPTQGPFLPVCWAVQFWISVLLAFTCGMVVWGMLALDERLMVAFWNVRGHGEGPAAGTCSGNLGSWGSTGWAGLIWVGREGRSADVRGCCAARAVALQAVQRILDLGDRVVSDMVAMQVRHLPWRRLQRGRG
jgi:hypothetical protein